MSGSSPATTPNNGSNVLTWKMNSTLVLSASQPKNAEPMPPRPKLKPEEQSCHHTNLVWFQFGGVDKYCGKGGRDDKTDDYGKHNRRRESHIRQGKSERSSAKDRAPYHIFPPIPVAYAATDKCADCHGCKESEQAQLGCLYAHTELIDEEKREIACHTRHVEILEKVRTHSISSVMCTLRRDNACTAGLGTTAFAFIL